MLLLEAKVKHYLEDKRSAKEKLLEEFEVLKLKEAQLRLFGMLSDTRNKKWMKFRVKYHRRKVFNLGIWQVSWKNIAIGKR